MGGIQRYKCTNCNKNFSSKKRPIKLQKVIFNEYFDHKQTLQQIAVHHKRSIPWVKKQILAYEPEENVFEPKEVTLVCDATFYGRRKDKLGTLVFKDEISKKIVIWKHISSETINEYKYLISELIDQGFTLKSMTIDGKRGLYRLFEEIPKQMCHFHQIAIIRRYLTRNPKLEASIELKKIVARLTTTTEIRFQNKLELWYEKYEDFLNEKTVSSTTGEEHFTHPRVRAAYRSLQTNLPYLFTYKKLKDVHIPNTTNSLEGGVFSPMKFKINPHRGMSKSFKLKMVDEFLVNYNKK